MTNWPYPLILSLLVAFCATGCGSASLHSKVAPAVFQNPLLKTDFPDPAVLRASDGYYYAYATGPHDGGRRNFSVSRSKDLVTWETPVEALPEKPVWASRKGKFWAPHVIEHEGMYLMFYSAEPDWSEHERMRLAIATSRSPMGPFVDIGQPMETGDAEENIDPMPFVDPATKKPYLYWGRNGILAVQELASDLKSFAPGSSYRELLHPTSKRHSKIVEAPYVLHEGGWYYLFHSGDDCCTRLDYAVSVARSKSALGPFERHGPILVGNDEWLAPGHNSVVTDEKGQHWIVYHAVHTDQRTSPATGAVHRMLFMDRLEFVNGWPRVRGPHSEVQPAPAAVVTSKRR